MANAKDLAGLIGPALVAIAVSEAWNYRIFAANTLPVVYLNGTILFVAGLAIIRAHNHWSLQWPVVLTLAGWLLASLGMIRMFAPALQSAAPQSAQMSGMAIAFAIGCFLTFQAYRPGNHHTQP